MAKIPTTSITVNRDLLIEPLKPPVHPHNYLDNFPDEVYNKSVDSVLVKFLNALLGPSGAGWIRKNYLDVRLMFEESGLELDQLEQFYGNPLKFGRLALETYGYETTGDLDRAAWDEIKAKDEAYRNRVIDFFHAARLGGTVDGMALAARSGLGYNVKIVENYKYLFDQHSDYVIDIDNFGTPSESYQYGTEEFVILPDQEYSRSVVKKLNFSSLPATDSGSIRFKYGNEFTTSNYKLQTGVEQLTSSWTLGTGWTLSGNNVYTHSSGVEALSNSFTPTNNTYYRIYWTIFNRTTGSIDIALGGVTASAQTASGQLDIKTTSTGAFTVTPTTGFNGSVKFSVYKLINYDITPNSTAYDFEIALSSLPSINDNVTVTGNQTDGFVIQFTGQLANQSVLPLSVELTNCVDSNGTAVTASISTIASNNIDSESVFITDADKKNLVSAIDQIKPVNTYSTYQLGRSKFKNQTILNSASSGDYYEVIRCVTGANEIAWPEVDSIYWIEKGIEKQAPRIQNDLQYHYRNFHKPANIYAYVSEATNESDYITSNYLNVINNNQYKSTHTGQFNQEYEKKLGISGNKPYKANLALPTFAEPPLVTTQANYSGIQFINGIYPMGDKMQSVIDNITQYTKPDDFWASAQKNSGSDYLEIDLGSPKAVNLVTFDIVQSPIEIEISFDEISDGVTRNFVNVIPEDLFPFDTSIDFDDSLNQVYWQYLNYNFTNEYKEIPFTRFIRIKFTRKTGLNYRFLSLKSDGTENEWPILIRNLRIGRSV